MMITHDQLIHAIEQETGLTHGADFLVAHPLGEDRKTQCGDAYLLRWSKSDVPKPDIEAMKRLYYSQYEATFLAARVREKRDYLIQQTDWTQSGDVPAALKTKFSVYRQALRDLTDQPGFPKTIDWPTSPQ